MNNTEFLDLMGKTNNWINILNSNDMSNFPNNWSSLREVQLAHISIINDFIKKPLNIPEYHIDKGIVIGAGGAKYFGCAFACFHVLRSLGCSLPFEFWYLDEFEMDNNMKNLCKIHEIDYINATKFCQENHLNPRILNGWELKPFATLHSKFKQVLYLDADNIPVKNPEYLFEDSSYKELGSIFWPDLPPYQRKEWLPEICWQNVGLEYRNEVDFETGQYMINKEKCYRPLELTMWMNEHSDWFYNFVYGDKSTFHLAWRKCNFDYVIPERSAGWKHPCILQYDNNRELIFQHACQGKELMFDGRGPTNQYNHHLVKEAKQIRSKYWGGIIYSWNDMSNEEKILAQTFIGKYKYTRVNIDSRSMELLDNGIIGEGNAKCERRWSVCIMDGIPSIVVIGAAHKNSEIAMFFAKDSGDSKLFNGRWTAFERCEVILERMD
jgi:hypothetical protein